MGTNLLFTIFSFVLFGTLLVSDNNLVTSAIQLSSETEVSQAAFALAQSVIDEAKTKAFDRSPRFHDWLHMSLASINFPSRSQKSAAHFRVKGS